MTQAPMTDAERDDTAYSEAIGFARARIRQTYGSELVERGRELANQTPPAAAPKDTK